MQRGKLIKILKSVGRLPGEAGRELGGPRRAPAGGTGWSWFLETECQPATEGVRALSGVQLGQLQE